MATKDGEEERHGVEERGRRDGRLTPTATEEPAGPISRKEAAQAGVAEETGEARGGEARAMPAQTGSQRRKEAVDGGVKAQQEVKNAGAIGSTLRWKWKTLQCCQQQGAVRHGPWRYAQALNQQGQPGTPLPTQPHQLVPRMRKAGQMAPTAFQWDQKMWKWSK